MSQALSYIQQVERVRQDSESRQMQALYFQTGRLLLENNDAKARGSEAQLGLGFCDHKRAPGNSAMRSRIKRQNSATFSVKLTLQSTY